MGDIPASVVLNLLLFLTIPFCMAFLARKAKLPPLVGYMLGGLILGNFFPQLTRDETTQNIAYFGIVFLLFTIGLETNFSKMMTLRKYILIGGALQIVFSIVLIMILSFFFRFSWLQSFLIGIALSSSSTTVVAKTIQDRGEESSFVGEVALGILIFQDIAFIPFMIVFSTITGPSQHYLTVFKEIMISLAKAGLIITALFYFGRKIVPVVFPRVAKLSREIFNLFIVVFVLFISGLSLKIGIPVLVSVFVAGVLLAQTG